MSWSGIIEIIRETALLEVVLLSYSFLVLSLNVSLVPSMVRLGILRPWRTSLLRISMPARPIYFGIDGDAREGEDRLAWSGWCR